jgi:branched-chain amino acid transport system substrate-binding protein
MWGMFTKIPKKAVFFSLAALIFLAACAALSSAGAPPTVKIGFVAPVEGLHRPLGYEALFGVKLALQQRNMGRGLNGYRVELVALNDFDDPIEAKIQARALVADPDVLGVVGHLSAATTQAAMPVYKEAKLAVSTPWTIATSGLNTNQAGVVSLAASDIETTARLVAVARAMGFDDFTKLVDNDISHITNNTQALQLATDAVTGGEIILALHQANISLPLFGQVDVGSWQLLQTANTAADGLIFVSPGPDPRHVSGANAFIEAYQDLAGFPPGPRAVLAYDTTNVLLDAIEQAIVKSNNQPNRFEISALIGNIERDGISGHIAFDAQGQRVDAPVWVYQISGGEYPGALVASE